MNHPAALVVLWLANLVAPPPGATQAGYTIEPLPRTIQELRARFTPAQIDTLEKLNRRDREHLVRIDPPVPGLVVPVVWETDDLRYSPLPLDWAAVAAHAKYVVVHQPFQVFGAYEFGKLVRWGPVSSGRRETPTPAGAFNLTWRSRKRTSTDNDAWVLEWYFNFVNARGVSFHQFELPGYAASHSCVRLLQRDAEWLYGWGDQWKLSADRRTVEQRGTPVLVLGVFAHAAPPPWTSLAALSGPLSLPLQPDATGETRKTTEETRKTTEDTQKITEETRKTTEETRKITDATPTTLVGNRNYGGSSRQVPPPR